MLYTIESSGNLYAVNPADGSWKQVGDSGAWKDTIAGVGMGGKLYTIESGGSLYETDPQTGRWNQLGNSEFENTKFLFAASGNLYTIESSGNLYKVQVK